METATVFDVLRLFIGRKPRPYRAFSKLAGVSEYLAHEYGIDHPAYRIISHLMYDAGADVENFGWLSPSQIEESRRLRGGIYSMNKTDWAWNLSIGATILLFVFFAGYVFGRQSGLESLYQDLSAQRAQMLRDLAKYPLGHAKLIFTTDGVEATCER